MKISEYILHLEAIMEDHGDLRVTKYNPAADVMSAYPPEVKFIREKKPRESKTNYVNRPEHLPVEKVCHV